MTEHERTQCATLAALLHAGALLGLWGFALSAISAAVLALVLPDLSLTATLCFGGTVLLGLLERYFAFRLRFDERLFDGLAQGHVVSLLSLDVALERLGLRTAPRPARGLDERMHATRQLLQRHGVLVICQSLMFMLALMTETLK
ncbi:MAG: hypothetical protein EOO29_15005 [Comamonadaceae bacterium]|nr:MAG: hypothetical protein EOO29_15005 [Comamonadaceae bacterium]